MKRYITKKLSYIGIFVVYAIFCEMILLLQLGEEAVSRYFLMEIAAIFLIAGLIFLLPKKVDAAFVLVLLLVQTVLCCACTTLFAVYCDIFTFDVHVLVTEAQKSIEGSFIKPLLLLPYVLLYAALVYLVIRIEKGKGAAERKVTSFFRTMNRSEGVRLVIVSVLAFVIVFGGSLGIYTGQVERLNEKKDHYSILSDDAYLYENRVMKLDALSSFGLYSFYYKDFCESFLPVAVPVSEEEEAKKFFEEGKKAEPTEFFGLLSENNVITVMLESFEWYAITEEYTPNLYRMMNEGLTFRNNVSKNKTNHSEGAGILGSYPSMSAMPAEFGTHAFPFSLPNLLKKEGVVSRYFHDNEGTFYSRLYTHGAFGFDELYFPETVSIEQEEGFGLWVNDSEFVAATIEKMAPADEQFYSFFTTVSTHGPFDGTNASVAENYERLVADGYTGGFVFEDEALYDAFRWYIAGVIETDRAIGLLLDRLENTVGYDGRKLIDSTTLIFYSDHYSYYYDMNFITRGMDATALEDKLSPEAFDVPFFIFDKTLNEQEIDQKFLDQPTCSYNIVPTVLDLFGIEFCENYYIGYSLFSEEHCGKTVHLSITEGFLNDKIYSRNGMEYLSIVEGTTEEELTAFTESCEQAYLKQKYLDILYRSNLYGPEN